MLSFTKVDCGDDVPNVNKYKDAIMNMKQNVALRGVLYRFIVLYFTERRKFFYLFKVAQRMERMQRYVVVTCCCPKALDGVHANESVSRSAGGEIEAKSASVLPRRHSSPI